MAVKKKPKKPKKPAANLEGRLIPPPNGAVVRMYRIGHGDCFLLAFAGKKPDQPVYVLIDCGYKPGSTKKIPTAEPPTVKEIAESIRIATGGHIDVAIITHEHQDHVNAITQGNFKDITIGEAWFSWTEDPTDTLANSLREKHKDVLLGLLAARRRLAADPQRAQRLDDLLAFELGGDAENFNAAAAEAMLLAATATSDNKESMKIVKDRAHKGMQFLRPHTRRPLKG